MISRKRNKKNNIIPQMFDVRPNNLVNVLVSGKRLELSRLVELSDSSASRKRKKTKECQSIDSRRKILDMWVERKGQPRVRKIRLPEVKVIQLNKFFHNVNALPAYIELRGKAEHENKKSRRAKRKKLSEEGGEKVKINYQFGTSNGVGVRNDKFNRFFGEPIKKENIINRQFELEEDVRLPILDEVEDFSTRVVKKINLAKKLFSALTFKPALGLATFSIVIFALMLFSGFASTGWQKKDEVVTKGITAINHLVQAKEEIFSQNFQGADQNIESAVASFGEASRELDQFGGKLSLIFKELPFLSKISTGKNLLNAGEEISKAIGKINETVEILNGLKNPLENNGEENLGVVLINASDQIVESKKHLEKATDYFNQVKISDLPEEYQSDFYKISEALPKIVSILDKFEDNYQIFYEIFGFNGPRKYLFLFQNNQEMRATGGFIGSYGVLSMDNGKVESLFIDGIFNPDGQLWEKVVPPKPIQKISAAWSTHDANWFPNFPTSAEKIAWFYEKTGGPTVDGVITITPTVLQRFLEITGPIEMPDYEVTLDEDNFIEKTQYEVEEGYDKEQNQPKKIIADLAPIVLGKIFQSKDPKEISKTINVLGQALKEKHILLYSFNYNVQKLLAEQNWSGEIIQTNGDYLMVINSNINGFKTDGVIEEYITHNAKIQKDGSIIDTVKIKRVHNGGNMELDWWNKVNSNYMRVYVPKGSQLIEVKGHTREFEQSPLDYNQLNFRRDPDVEKEEQSMEIDEQTGTRIYEEQNKTVFANWVYVSPQETAEIEYKYRLPFSIDLENSNDHSDSYSILFQKQAGSIGSKLNSSVNISEDTEVIWEYPQGREIKDSEIKMELSLEKDFFVGLVVGKKQQNF